MAFTIAVMGESGAGKTTAMRTLPPEQTFYIDCDKKGMSWKGWRAHYNTEHKNYFKSSDKDKILTMMQRINSDKGFANIKYVVIDTLNGIMVDDEMARMKEKTYDKWADLAFAVYGLVAFALNMRDDLTVIFTAHAQVERNDDGMLWARIKTSGKKLDKIVLESKFTVVFYAKCIDGEYVFETHSNNSTAKTPMGAFDEMTIPNDMKAALDRLEEYR